MGWQRVELVVPGARAEALADALAEAGALSTDLADADAGTPAEQAVFGEPGADEATWPRTRVSALFAEEVGVAGIVDAFLDGLSIAPLEPPRFQRVADADWVTLTQRQFAPIRAGERLWIVPTWHEAPEPGAVNIVLDPGAAFGTGSHPTTALCLAWLERHVAPGDTVLDYGCGSGILAIAAMRLGAAAARAVDIDPLALEAARYNARRNDVAVEVLDAHLAVPGAASLTIANILANPLRMLAPTLASHTRPGGRIALSGILASQVEDVAQAYAPWAKLAVEGEEAGWVILAGVREDRAC